MSKKEADILQIRKYLNGELDAKAMHQLERRAQDDPFLMDALEGYENTRNDQYANLNEISKRLQQRVAPKQRRIIPWKYIAAAAAVLIFLTIGGLFLHNYQSANKIRVADIEKPANKASAEDLKKPDSEKENKIAASIPAPRPEHLQKLSANNNASADERPPVLHEITVASAAKPNKNDTVVEQAISSSVAAVNPEDLSTPTEKTQADKALQGRAAGVIVDNYSKASHNMAQLKNVVTGRVIETDHGLPVIGATVKVAGTNTITHTNIDGYFSIPADSSKDKLYIANIGYQSRQVSTRSRDSLGKIALQPDNSALSEVVVVGYGASKKTGNEAADTSAHPSSGWSNFNKYLKKNAVLPDGSTGVVKLSFKVTGNGSISDISIVKGLSKIADQKAIDLINNGPAWIGNADGQTQKVNVKVKFVKAK